MEKKLEVNLEDLRKKSLFVATPMYGGNCSGHFTKSLLVLKEMCMAYGIKMEFFAIFNESLITRARNYCVDAFMRSDYTHLLFIDSDIEFNPNDALALLHLASDDKHVVCGPYPKKNISWEKVKVAVDKGFADENPNILERFAGDFVFNIKNSDNFKINEMIEIHEGGTGFMIIQREVFNGVSEKCPELHYKPDHVRSEHFDGSRTIVCYFDTLIDPESLRYLSEDYMFCRLIAKHGYKTWLCPWMEINHIGSMKFVGDLQAIAAAGVSATADPEQLKRMKKT